MQLLLWGSDPAWGATLQRWLLARGHAVEWLRQPCGAAAACALDHFDVVLLEWLAGRPPDARALARLRCRDGSAALLAIIPAGGSEDRVRALDQGADDCLAWPCDLHELEARCRVLSRRRRGLASQRFEHAGFCFEADAHRASIHGRELRLPRREFALLGILVGRFDRVVRKPELGRLLFRDGGAADGNAVELYVARLRRRLDGAGVCIRTVRGVGYRLEAVAGTAVEPAPVSEEASAAAVRT